MKTKELATDRSTEALIEDSGIDGPIVLHGYDVKTHSAVLKIERDYPNSSRFCTIYADTVLQYEIEARAELVLRALRSFEAMREALKLMLERSTPLSKCNVKKDYSYMVARVAAENALRLSEGEPDRWANRYAEGKAVQS